METHVILRQSPDWGRISDEEFRKQSREFCLKIHRPAEQVNLSVDLWNKTFKKSFLELRQEIKDLAISNFRDLAGVSLYIDGYTPPESFAPGYYLFIDDDDWLNPGISTLLKSIENGHLENGIVWGSVVFGNIGEHIIVKRKADGYCYTNNYAITGHFLSGRPGSFQKVFQHNQASRVLKSLGSKIVDEYWSVTNKNPSSTVHMEKILNQEFSSRSLEAAVRDFLKRCENIEKETDDSFSWAVPLMKKVSALFEELL